MKSQFYSSLLLVLVLALFGCRVAKQQASCKPCDNLAILPPAAVVNKMALENLFCSIQADCLKTNVEFSEGANEALFEALDKAPLTFLALFEAAKAEKQHLVLGLLASPVSDEVNLDALAKKLAQVNGHTAAKEQVLAALETALGKR